MGRYLIQTPVKDASTDLGPVHFHQGKAEMDEVPYWLRNYCEQNGYTITDTQPPADAADGVPDDDNTPVTPPPGNASTEAWREHVLAIGTDRVFADNLNGLSRDQLKELAAELAKESGQQ